MTGETDSDADPTTHLASPAVWIYYVDFATTIRQAQFRWANTGIRYESNQGVGVTHTVENCLFQEDSVGIYVSQYSTVSLSNVEQCDVATPASNGGTVYGQMMMSPLCDTPASLLMAVATSPRLLRELAIDQRSSSSRLMVRLSGLQ